MQKIYLNFPSITFALKSNKLFNLNKINSQLVKTPAQFSKCGCGHSVVIDISDLEHAKMIIKQNNIVLNDIQELWE